MKHIIWSDMDIINDESLEYAKETLLECYEEEEIIESMLHEFLYEDNGDMFDCEVSNLSYAEETAGDYRNCRHGALEWQKNRLQIV